MPVVMVEIAPPTAPAALVEALLDACSRAVRVGECAVDDGKVSGEPVAVAVVHWEDQERSRFRVEVGVRNAGEPVWNDRSLDFDIADPPAERWKAAGLTIATLAGEMVAGAERAAARAGPLAERRPTSSARDAGSTAPPKASERSTARRRILWIGASAGTGPGLEDGPFRVAGRVDAGWKPTELPLFPRLSLGFAARPQDFRGLSAQWETATLGVGGLIGGGLITVEPRVALGVDFVHAHVQDPSSRREDAGTDRALGVYGGIDAVFRVGSVGFLASFDAWQLTVPTNILVRNQRVGGSPSAGWTVGGGFRVFIQ